MDTCNRLSELETRAEVDERAVARPDDAGAVTLLGRLRAPADVYVVRVAPKDGRDELRFYDAASFALVRKDSLSRPADRHVVYLLPHERRHHGGVPDDLQRWAPRK
jgi:hypothetical protein